jgi:hypothetical protein
MRQLRAVKGSCESVLRGDAPPAGKNYRDRAQEVMAQVTLMRRGCARFVDSTLCDSAALNV